MAELYEEKIFEFSKLFTDNSECVGNIKIKQIGETCLDAGASIESHIQSCHEITLILSGEGVLTANDEKISCSAGDIQVISEGTTHSIIASKSSRLRYIHFAFTFSNFNPKILEEFYSGKKNLIIKDNGEISALLNMVVEEYFNHLPYTDIVRNNLVQLLLVMIWRKSNAKPNKYKPSIKQKTIGVTIYDIIKYIDKHLSEELSVESIAKRFSYSKSYISSLFKAKTGVPIKEYIIDARMKKATLLLDEGKCTLSEIAILTGYKSVQSFSKRYKSYTGKTPGEMRKSDL